MIRRVGGNNLNLKIGEWVMPYIHKLRNEVMSGIAVTCFDDNSDQNAVLYVDDCIGVELTA